MQDQIGVLTPGNRREIIAAITQVTKTLQEFGDLILKFLIPGMDWNSVKLLSRMRCWVSVLSWQNSPFNRRRWKSGS